jgi:hypothetical protein
VSASIGVDRNRTDPPVSSTAPSTVDRTTKSAVLRNGDVATPAPATDEARFTSTFSTTGTWFTCPQRAQRPFFPAKPGGARSELPHVAHAKRIILSQSCESRNGQAPTDV